MKPSSSRVPPRNTKEISEKLVKVNEVEESCTASRPSEDIVTKCEVKARAAYRASFQTEAYCLPAITAVEPIFQGKFDIPTFVPLFMHFVWFYN